jgi:hypothetical protein
MFDGRQIPQQQEFFSRHARDDQLIRRAFHRSQNGHNSISPEKRCDSIFMGGEDA